MPKNVTYLLGAGASIDALPTIETLTDEIGEFGKNLKSLILDSFKNPDEVLEFADNLVWLHNLAQNHLTVDTLAKKMFLRKEWQKLEKLKRTLSLFFTFKQRLNHLDRRYDALLAALLENNGPSLKLPDHVKVLTWNYDSQIELSAMDYLNEDIKDTMESISSFPRNPHVNFDRLPSIVHLNGIAGFYHSDRNRKQLGSLFRSDSNTLPEICDEILFSIQYSERDQISFTNLLSFAWEESELSKKGLEFAAQIMEKTDILVVIGYSVPFFNREVDRMLFYDRFINTGGNPKKIYFQNPYLDGSFLAAQFNINEKFIEHIEDCRQFFIPHEL